jgi:hypothetical protein
VVLLLGGEGWLVSAEHVFRHDDMADCHGHY